MQLIEPKPYREALDKIGRRSLIGSMLTSSEWADVPVALRERAFWSSQVESVRFLQRGRDGINDFLSSNRETVIGPDGVGRVALKTGSRAQFVDQMRAFAIAEGMGPLDPKDAGTIKDIRSERRLGIIFDVQTRQAQDYGYWRQGMDSHVLNEFPAMRFIRVLPVKEPRDWHTQFEDQVYLKTDPVWTAINRDFGVPWGPWGWGCGHDVEDVDRDEAEALGLIQPGEKLDPAPALKDFNQDLEASTRGIDADLLLELGQRFGGLLEIVGETMKWRRLI